MSVDSDRGASVGVELAARAAKEERARCVAVVQSWGRMSRGQPVHEAEIAMLVALINNPEAP